MHRIFKQFETSGVVARAGAQKSRPELRSLDEHSELIVIGLIVESPTLYLHEICDPPRENQAYCAEKNF